ncbi:MAG TPA: T9SS type A sorting domain-containing protein [Chitinophagales bacterium]|nr:T9SS type A sorting domain-containing protein [Chitinophagales bacterium]
MRITFTNFSLAFPCAEKRNKGQTNQSFAPGFNTSTPAHRQTKLKMLTVIVCALMILVVSTAKAQPAGAMVAGSYPLTGSVTWYDPGGAGGGACPSAVAGNYTNNLNITETMTANPGQKIVVSWAGGLFGLSTGDVLTVYDGPTTASPVLASYTNTINPIPAIIGQTSTNSITFLFTSDATNTCKGWQATVAAYYYMQPGSFSFSCPGTYTFLDPQNAGSGLPGGDATCQFSGGNTKDYQDASMIETFSTSNGQCIQVDGTFPNNFGICALDTLKVFDGPSILSPVANGGAAVYTNTLTNPAVFSTLGSSATFQFIAAINDHERGWQISMSCVNCPAASINNDCANAIVLTPGASCNAIASSVSVSNSNNPFLAPCVGTATDDVWYRFVANNSSTQIIVTPTDGSMDPVVQLLSGTCGSFTSLYCQNSSGAGGAETLNAIGLTIGNTYYVRVYDFVSANANHTFNICVVGAANTDCLAAQQACSLTPFTHTNNNYPDFGIQEYNGSYWGCEVSGEFRSGWYYWQIATSGKFGFNIYSTSGASEDDDFALWGPLTGLNCPMSTSPLRCSWAIPYYNNSYGLPHYSTGLQTGAGDNSESAGGDAFVETVNATAGQWYVLVVNIYAGPNQYNISWMDNIPSNQQATFSTCILPIELLSFTGENVGLANILNWTTASETDNDYFAIERSPDGEHFTELGTMKAAGTSMTEMKYDFPDRSPLSGINYYRLRQTDFDGTYTYSNIIAIDNGSITPVVPFVYPNPSNGAFNIGLMAASSGDVTLQVFNAIGQLVTATNEHVQSGQNNFTLDLSSFNQGIYTLVIRDSRSGSVYTNKIVKM